MSKKVKYILFLILCGFVGGCFGYAVRHFEDLLIINWKLSQLYDGIYCIGVTAQIILITISFILYFRARYYLDKMGPEFDEVLECKAGQLSTIGCITTNSTMIIGLSVAPIIFMMNQSSINLIVTFLFAVSMLLSIVSSALLFGLIKKTNPEKDVSFYDKKADKRLVSQMDEAEKQVLGVAAYETQIAMKSVFSAIMVIVFMLCAIVSELVIVNVFIGTIWCIQSIMFALKANQLERGRIK